MSFLRQSSGLLISNLALLVSQGLTLVVLGLALSADPVALFLLGTTFAQTAAVFATWRFDSGIPGARGRAELGALLRLAATASVITALALVFVLVAIRQMGLFSFARLAVHDLALVLALTIGLALFQVGRYWAIRQGDLRAIQRATYMRAGTVAAARFGVAGFAFARVGLASDAGLTSLLLAGELAATLMGLLPLFPFARVCERLRRRTLTLTLRRNWKYPSIETPSAMLDMLSYNAPIFLIAQFYDLKATAAFGLAYRIVAVPLGQLALAVTEVLQVRYGTMIRERRYAEFEHVFLRSSLLLACGGGAICLVAGLALEPIIVLIAGENQRLFAQMAAVILPWVAMNVLVNVNSRIINLLRRQELKLIYDFTSALGVGALVALHLLVDPPALDFVIFLSAYNVAAYVLYWLLIRKAVRDVTWGWSGVPTAQ